MLKLTEKTLQEIKAATAKLYQENKRFNIHYEAINAASNVSDFEDAIILDLLWLMEQECGLFFELSDWSKLSITQTILLLHYQIEIVDFINFTDFSGSDIAMLLRFSPILVTKVDTSKMTKFEWLYVLGQQPTLISSYDNIKNLDEVDIMQLIYLNIEFVEYCDIEPLSYSAMTMILKDHPVLAHKFPQIKKLQKIDLVVFINEFPQFINYCNTSTLDVFNWISILNHTKDMTLFDNYCNYSKWGQSEICSLICEYPQLAKHFDVYKIHRIMWSIIIGEQPQLKNLRLSKFQKIIKKIKSLC